jgi:adenosylcobinamide-GDP ribazoletransferase
LGRFVVEGATLKELKFAAIFSFVTGLALGWKGFMTWAFALAIGFALTWVWRRSLGGTTGDLLGATVEIGEIGALLFFATFH